MVCATRNVCHARTQECEKTNSAKIPCAKAKREVPQAKEHSNPTAGGAEGSMKLVSSSYIRYHYNYHDCYSYTYLEC